MVTTRQLFARLHDEAGQDLAEYTLILAFIAAVCVIVVAILGLAIAGGFGSIMSGF